MNDDLERLIGDSLDERAAGAVPTGAGIDAVYARVAHRRNRRRGVAAVGSVALIAVGVVAVAAVGDDDPVGPAAAPPESASLEGALGGSWAEYVPAGTPIWKCDGSVMHGDDEGNTYWADCESVTLEHDVGVVHDLPTPTTVSWTGDCWATTSVPGDSYATSVPCQFAPATTAPWTSAVTDSTIVWCEPWVTAHVAADTVPVTTVPCGTTPPQFATTTTICESADVAVTVTVPCSTVAPGSTGVPGMGEQEYQIQVGDSLMSIADQFDISVEVLAAYNEFADVDDVLLLPGTVIRIPPS